MARVIGVYFPMRMKMVRGMVYRRIPSLMGATVNFWQGGFFLALKRSRTTAGLRDDSLAIGFYSGYEVVWTFRR
ncbi:hypothetical protein M621_14050 [Serratia plymuthica S13]|uniref:Uncharacterized protein n=1 Tax=Serratia plymuthica S13 TaxID=1348660 RepID=S4YP60_SERPL|nr:hypothetical protein M621_14050 [Serratia plymuthica S13]ANJ98962.1 hypothetical protein ADP73_13810 [Serratia plymuthica]